MDADSTVSVDRAGVIEVKATRTDQSGRTNSIIERYRWDGDGFKYVADN